MTLNFHLTVSWISVDLQLVELRFTSSWSNFYGSLSCCSFPQTWNSWTHRTRRKRLGAWFLACSSQWICWAFALVPSFWGCGAALEPLGFCRWVDGILWENMTYGRCLGVQLGLLFFNGDMHAPQVHKLFVQKVSSFSWAAAISVATTRPAALMGEQRFNGEQTWTPLLYAPDIYIYTLW